MACFLHKAFPSPATAQQLFLYLSLPHSPAPPPCAMPPYECCSSLAPVQSSYDHQRQQRQQYPQLSPPSSCLMSGAATSPHSLGQQPSLSASYNSLLDYAEASTRSQQVGRVGCTPISGMGLWSRHLAFFSKGALKPLLKQVITTYMTTLHVSIMQSASHGWLKPTSVAYGPLSCLHLPCTVCITSFAGSQTQWYIFLAQTSCQHARRGRPLRQM